MIICWWSGGITSAVACKIAINLYGCNNCKVIMLDTKNEHPDTYRFKRDCEEWYELPIETLSVVGSRYDSIESVWEKYQSLNVAHGAVCSSELKRRVREEWERENDWHHQVFGFEFDKKEFNRAKSMLLNHGHTKPIFPLLMYGMDKDDCIKMVQDAGIEVPQPYKWGLRNNNCLGTGCVQGGIGYWKKLQEEHNHLFEAMAKREHRLTDLKGKPVTMLKDQSRMAKHTGNIQVFLKKHPRYPNLKCLDEMEGKPVEPLQECNGFCGVNDLNPQNKTAKEINFEEAES